MARHRNIFRPTYQSFALTLDTAPPQRSQLNLQSVDADQGDGIKIRHLTWTMAIGLVDTVDALTNLDRASGFVGFFKWPKDAAAPTTTTLDYKNRATVFGRKGWAVAGENAHRVTTSVKSVTLRPGESLFAFIYKEYESGTVIDTHGASIIEFWEHGLAL